MKCLEYPFDSEYILKRKKGLKRELLSEGRPRILKKIAVLGGSTTSEIKNILELFLLNYGIEPSFFESEYNQFYQDIMFENPDLVKFEPDIIYIHTSFRNISSFPEIMDSKEKVEDLLEKQYRYFEVLWKKVQDVFHCIVIQNNFEYPAYRLLGNKDASDIHGRVYFVTRLNQKFYGYAQQHENFYINDINYISSRYGLEQWSDPFYWYMYKYSCCVSAIPELAFNISNIIKSVFGKNKKGFVLDLDNTLWGGVIGDDGVENIEIGQETPKGQAYSEIQQYLLEQKQLGILLNINSKNNRENAMAGLARPDSVLKKDDFIVIKANWNPKDQNLLEISKELNLLPESFVFVDDNPAERAIVAEHIPGAAVPELEQAEHFIRVLDHSAFFEMTNFSEDDQKRNHMYKENINREALQLSAASYEDYLLSLHMEAEIKTFEPLYMARIVQLINKSNQFNLTTRRYSQTEIEHIANDERYITLYGKLEDRFGDNGVVSVVIGEIIENELHIRLWLMSCRVLKRQMETAMMDALVEKCQKEGIYILKGYYYPTSKNAMVKDFYQKQGFQKHREDKDGNTEWILSIKKGYLFKNKWIKVIE